MRTRRGVFALLTVAGLAAGPGVALAQGVAPFHLAPGRAPLDTAQASLASRPAVRGTLAARPTVECPMPIFRPSQEFAQVTPVVPREPARYYIQIAPPGCTNPLNQQSQGQRRQRLRQR